MPCDDWDEMADQELIELAESSPEGGEIAAHMFELYVSLKPNMVADLPRLRSNVAEIRYWDKGQYTIYFRIDGENAYKVLHIGKTHRALRVRSNTVAISRA